ncbi:MAG TPA: helix-turn-helix domain-containing protein [Chitinophagaceae bacterium]|jgi:DNA-binding CsgD family transcriptional regulator|nr:helix-turn-helix domain-containing protein [Chitinophagaceae bacterium]
MNPAASPASREEAFPGPEPPDTETQALFRRLGYPAERERNRNHFLYRRNHDQNTCHYWNKDTFRLLTGYAPECLARPDDPFFLSIWNKTDLKTYRESIYPEMVHFASRQGAEDLPFFTYSFNFRILHSEERFRILRLHCVFPAAGPDGPAFTEVGILTGHPHAASDFRMVLTIERAGPPERPLQKDQVLKLVYAPGPSSNVFTIREREILQYISEGYSSKEIAQSLFVSINTVNNHRKNMLQKTHTSNCFQLVSFALKNCYL